MRILYTEGSEWGVVTRGSGRESLRYNLTLIALLVLSWCGDRSEADAYVAQKIVSHQISTANYIQNLVAFWEKVPQIANHEVYKKLMESDLESIGSEEYKLLKKLEKLIRELQYPELMVDEKYKPSLYHLKTAIENLKKIAGMRFFAKLEEYKRFVVQEWEYFYLCTTPELATQAGLGLVRTFKQSPALWSPESKWANTRNVVIFQIDCTETNTQEEGRTERVFDCNKWFVGPTTNPAQVIEGVYGVDSNGKMYGAAAPGKGYEKDFYRWLDGEFIVGGYLVSREENN